MIIKFRQENGSGGWHYWGYVGGGFVGPITSLNGGKSYAFTGLKDKNGKEIYEGDILPCVYAFDGCTEHMMVVEWNNERAAFFPRWDYAKCHQKGVSKTMRDLTRLEVIGNIYENPELLK